ncbi:hypothetical protein PMAYCL1PPCAC_31754 [Pristionchus mayeri]|uniref:G-protein coupled receptors family 1 profile domain-containing protein n=1 Tax=Pristionchus mayeri TaxID=1317129 RepID=A0AAN5IEF4_9BILA|nr:hypothetical protein PMAYCL1PPCAC_31754 [Pristionchus mayeri]
MVFENDCMLLRITYFSNGFLFNLLPSTLMVIFSAALIHRLRRIQKKHTEMFVNYSLTASVELARSSRMIILIVLITLITDIPQVTVNMLISCMADRFRSEVANKLESLIATLVVIASACNLIIHVCMSRRFREVKK